jgi:hypothetical protein
MRVRGAIAIAVLVAALVVGCGGGSTSTGAAKPRVAGAEGVIFIEGGPARRIAHRRRQFAGPRRRWALYGIPAAHVSFSLVDPCRQAQRLRKNCV